MKSVFMALLLVASPVAFADYQLVCRQKVSTTQQKIEVFSLRGATQSFQQTWQVIHVKQISQIPVNPYASVSNQDKFQNPKFERAEYPVLRVQKSANGDSFLFSLNGGGRLNFKFDFGSKLWNGHFIRPNGPEFPQMFSGCTLENPEIGFTAHN